MSKNLLLLLLLMAFYLSTQAQKTSLIDIPTPNAASLGRFGQVPVNFFNGLATVSVPIYSFQYKDIKVPISLDYHAGGNRTDDYPGWVGLGWNLSAGGAITRIVNGLPDEITATDLNYQIASGYTYPTDKEYGYFYRSRDLDRDDWDSTSSLEGYLNSSNIALGLRPYDAEPDEFMFNAGDLNGSFFMGRDRNGNLIVKVKSKNGEHLKIEPILSTGTVELVILKGVYFSGDSRRSKVKMRRTFLSFVITRGDGTKYHFGGDLNSIDLNSTPAGLNLFTLATTWHLTKIESANGYAVNFEYKKEGDVFMKKTSRTRSFFYIYGHENCDFCPETRQSYTLQHPSYLSRIVSPNGTEVELTSNKAEQLSFDFSDLLYRNAFEVEELNQGKWTDDFFKSSYWLKLDQIKIRGGREITFNYANSPSQRLRLGSMIFSNPGNTTTYKYTFSYNPAYLPAYNAKESDNWGYYNNKSYDNYDYNQMYDYRSPHPKYMKAESLEKITYPTGGETIFEYEPHDYAKVARQYPFMLETKSETETAGGLRIRKIISKTSSSDAKPLVWEYLYKNDDNTSSGILSGIPVYTASGRQHVEYKAKWTDHVMGVLIFGYWTSANYEQRFNIFSEYPQNPLSNTSGNHITYSRVIEKTPSNGYTVYRYSNSDAFADEAPVNVLNNIDSALITNPFTSRELERGLLLSMEYYDNDNNPIKKITNEYNDAPDRYNDYVKVINSTIMKGAGGWLMRFSANKIYTFYPYLKKQTLTAYGSLNPVVTVTKYSYEPQYRLLKEETSTDSRGEILKKRYKYPFELSGTSPYSTMVQQRHMVSQVVEQSSFKNATFLQSSKTNYKDWGNNIIAPVTIETKIGAAPPETRMRFHNYDSRGNLLSMSQDAMPVENVAKTSYRWGYDRQYPVAEARNAVENEFYYEGFEDDLGAAFSVSQARTGSRYNSGRPFTIPFSKPNDKVYVLSWWEWNGTTWVFQKETYTGSKAFSSNQVIDDIRICPVSAELTTYTYEPSVGISSKTDPNGRTTFYEYDGFGRLITVRDFKGNVLKKYDYHWQDGED